MTILFISDLHLEESRHDITVAFNHFIQSLSPEVTSLYILGDFFEVWIGDDYQNPFINSIKSLLHRAVDAGLQIHLMNGNRDFLYGEQFFNDTGCMRLPDPSVIDVDGERVLLCHGDHLCTSDSQYMAFRKLVRAPDWQREFLGKSLDERMQIARQLRNASQAQMAAKNKNILDITESEVAPFMKLHHVKKLIHGHTHRPKIHHLTIDEAPAQRIVLGDWYHQTSCLSVENGTYTLAFKPLV